MEIEVRSRTTGADDDLPAVLVRLAHERTTARDLIRRAVTEQIHELRADAARCRHVLDRQYRSDEEVRARGAVRVPLFASAEPDPTVEVERAWRAFTRGTFAISTGGRRVTGLDEEVVLDLAEPVVFVRLAPPAG
ncbi:hypothetical protein [Actinocatenispora rupis]|uniref:Uncharacterized protein n=1 Tax=Actinocatenispora rupis TaxID=519421 RepID=A0A8J3NDQ5_9ACTN|nr:hypothetical protein [Actinocatenispora rupis]GID15276.1 hypothetical protein Aru02nite_61650 [Actinocatenispora rupis]